MIKKIKNLKDKVFKLLKEVITTLEKSPKNENLPVNKNCIVTSIYPNDPFAPLLYKKSLTMFENFSETCNADFKDYRKIIRSPMIKKIKREIKKFKDDRGFLFKEKKLAQLNKLSIFEDSFLKGYDWVAWIDADVVIHPDAENLFSELLDKKDIYWGNRPTVKTRKKPSKSNVFFTNSLKADYKKEFNKFGVGVVIIIHKEAWNKLYKTIMDLDFAKYIDDIKLFQKSGIDQALLALAVNVSGIEQNIDPEGWKKKYLYHMTGEKIRNYLGIHRSSQKLAGARYAIKRLIIADMLLKIEDETIDLAKFKNNYRKKQQFIRDRYSDIINP